MSDITREDIIEAFPLREIMQTYGVELQNVSGKLMAICPFHADKNPSMQFYEDQHFHCYGCGAHGTVIDFVALRQNQDSKDVFKMLVKKLEGTRNTAPVANKPAAKESYTTVETYTYADEHGTPRYYVDRLEAPSGRKKFAQWVKDANGTRVNGLDGVERLLYRFPQVIAANEIVLCEGEKCVHALESMGYVASTNSGGSGGWLDGYAEHLAGKEVVIIPDGDAPGQKWLAKVKASMAGKVETLRIVNMPKPYNDIADVVQEMGVDAATGYLIDLWDKTTAVHRGIDLPILSYREMEQAYEKFVRRDRKSCIDLGCWLHTLGRETRPLYPGDLCTIIADTGTGKTAIMQNIARAIAPMDVLFFEIELTAELMAERNMAMVNRMDAGRVEMSTRQGSTPSMKSLAHVWTCVESKLDCDTIESITNRAELKIGRKPTVLMIDYIGLIRGGSGKRYERMSTVAEDLKILAKATNTIVFVSSQKKRSEETEIGLHDPKDSGSIENSSALVLGAWKLDQETLVLKILKQTKGCGGKEIYCNFEGAQSRITERMTQ